MSLIENERTKLLANALDRASTACFTVGVATPFAGFVYNVADFGSRISLVKLIFAAIVWFFVAVALHLAARRHLKGLKS